MSQSSPVKVLYVIDTLSMGGAEQSITQMACLRPPNSSYVCQIYPGDTLVERLDAAGVPRYALGVKAKYGWLKAAWRLRALVKQLKPDVLHTTLFRSGVVSRIVGLLTCVPVVDSFVSSPYSKVRQAGLQGRAKWKHLAIYWLDRATAFQPKLYVANSKSVALDNAKALAIDVNKVHVVYRGRNEQQFRPVDVRQRQEAKLALSCAPEATLLVYVGRLIARKRLSDVLSAMAELDNSDLQLLVVGDGPCRVDLEQQAKQLALKVEFIGQQQDVTQALAAADGFISAAAFEGLPGAVIEAALAGLPCLLSNIPMHREIDNKTGNVKFFEMGNVSDCTKVLSVFFEMSDVERAAIGQRLREVAQEQFTIGKMIAGHERVYAIAAGRDNE